MDYQLFRYMLAFNAKGDWPTKFNGGLLTVDPIYTDTINKGLTPDYRNWGGGLVAAQNQRLVYFPMIKSGDWDLLQPQLRQRIDAVQQQLSSHRSEAFLGSMLKYHHHRSTKFMGQWIEAKTRLAALTQPD